MGDTGQAETPLRDHVARFWKLIETETVRIVLDLKRTIGADAPDGPIVYWDGATFSDDVAKALIAERGQDALRKAAERVCWFDWSENDDDAVTAVEELRAALALTKGEP